MYSEGKKTLGILAEEETLSTRRHNEEQDLLERSTKKTKTTTESPMGEAPQVREGISLMDKGKEVEGGVLSFKQIVANETNRESSNQEDLDLISDDDDDDDDPNDTLDGGCPVIRITKEKKLRLRAKWKQTLIIKVFWQERGICLSCETPQCDMTPKGKNGSDLH